ncbi:MAG: hypothetical protein K2K63_14300 [Acetatifactor sp.]|nr:hypothetical protein [Acetatifactor sp.]
MNINIFKRESRNDPTLIPLGIAMDYRVKWNVHRILRDFIQNFYDSIGCEQFADEFQYKWEILEEKRIHIRMRTYGRSFSYEWLTYIGGSTKTGKHGYAGEYGEGFKVALLCLVKLGGDAVMSSGSWELRPCEYTEKIEGRKINMFGYHMREREDDGFTTLELYGIPASDENVRYVKEGLLDFFYPKNPLLADEIETAERYAVYARSAVKVPCEEYTDIKGIFYYKYIARGRLPFPAVIHMTEVFRNFDCDRSREILSEATVVGAVYKMVETLSPEASFWMLRQMEGQWQELPTSEKDRPADLNTWYYVICQLVRNVSSEPKWIKRFAQEYPLEKYAYIERGGGDSGKNRLLREAKRWFEQENKGENRRRLINPIFRLLGVASVFQEYTEKEDTLYRALDEKEQERAELLRACARMIFLVLSNEAPMPKILVHTEKKTKKGRLCLQYGILPYAETKTVRVFLGGNENQHIRYRVEEVVMEEEDLSTGTEFQKALLKYLGACVHMYGAERSERSNGVLTYIGAILYHLRGKVEAYEGRWKKT